ncbi:MAG: hypothetical protein ACREU9_00100 [Gammaproteobacteria bacterium]
MHHPYIDIVRQHAGRRYKISRHKMAEILESLHREGLDLNLEIFVEDPSGAIRARKWANACTGINCISVCDYGAEHGFGMRYDDPGSMHPLHHAVIMFVPAELGGYEYDQIGQMRRRADRVLVVSGEDLSDPPAPVKIASWIVRMRKHSRIDGTWARILDDGILEMRDVNDGQSSDPGGKCRHQYRVNDGYIEKRWLPPESVGDAWRDTGIPEWEPARTPPDDDLIYAWWEAQAL